MSKPAKIPKPPDESDKRRMLGSAYDPMGSLVELHPEQPKASPSGKTKSQAAAMLALFEACLLYTSLSSCAGDVHHSILGIGSDLSCGVGNFSVDPMFVNPTMCDYRLATGSPALTMSSNGGPIGWSK